MADSPERADGDANGEHRLLTIAPVGYEPVAAKEIARAREMLAEAESGKVSAFVFAAVGPDTNVLAYWTSMSPGDRINLLGQLQVLIAGLAKIELERLSLG